MCMGVPACVMCFDAGALELLFGYVVACIGC